MCLGPGEKPGAPRHGVAFGLGMRGGFTLIELLVVISIIALLMGILVPALGKIRTQARSILGAADQHQVVKALLCYASENGDLFPNSPAGMSDTSWTKNGNWAEPTTLVTTEARSRGAPRSMSTYLRSYIPDPSLLACRNAPREHEYLQEAWDAGDDWVNPVLGAGMPLTSTYCFYWGGYTGFLGLDEQFKGPAGVIGGSGESKVMMSCYFGYDHWRSRKVFSSCERFKGAGITEETPLGSAYYWASPTPTTDLSTLKIKLHATYMDTHVESYSPLETVPMEVIVNMETGAPYPPGVGPGVFFLPEDAVR